MSVQTIHFLKSPPLPPSKKEYNHHFLIAKNPHENNNKNQAKKLKVYGLYTHENGDIYGRPAPNWIPRVATVSFHCMCVATSYYYSIHPSNFVFDDNHACFPTVISNLTTRDLVNQCQFHWQHTTDTQIKHIQFNTNKASTLTALLWCFLITHPLMIFWHLHISQYPHSWRQAPTMFKELFLSFCDKAFINLFRSLIIFTIWATH